MKSQLIALVWALLGLMAAPQRAQAWTDHHYLTRTALAKVPRVGAVAVPVTSFEEMVRALGFKNSREFNESIQIRKEYAFDFKSGEKPGATALLVDVLSTYSDEPDWGMDKELFGADQYPELWRDEYSMMGGKSGTPSQSFRHMYWRNFHLLSPIKTFKLPLGRLLMPMGEAPERFRVFVELYRKANEKGHPYWAARFLACALHYVEDVAQPFHAAQTPTKKFIAMPFFDAQGSGLTEFVPQMTHIITYYHFAFEDYVARLLKENAGGLPHPEAKVLVDALSDLATKPGQLAYRKNLAEIVTKMGQTATEFAPDAGVASLRFFPAITVPYATLDASSYMNDAWWKQVMESGKADSEPKQAYFEVVSEMFILLGGAVREVVKGEMLSPGALYPASGVK